MFSRIAFVAGLAALFSAPAAAQVPLLDLRAGVHATFPSGETADAYDGGFGVYGRLGAPVGPLKLMASATWNRLGGKAGNDDIDIITLQAGPHFTIGLFDLGIEAGYFSEIDKIGFAPNISFALMNYEITATYNTTLEDPTASWISVGAGIRF